MNLFDSSGRLRYNETVRKLRYIVMVEDFSFVSCSNYFKGYLSNFTSTINNYQIIEMN